MTDDERREVAERLRGISRDVKFWGGVDPLHYVKKGVFGDVDRHGPNETIDRLADLIDPGDMSQMRRDTVACDREALLELAREMKFKAEESKAYFAGIYPGEVVEYARRIREACGEVVE